MLDSIASRKQHSKLLLLSQTADKQRRRIAFGFCPNHHGVTEPSTTASPVKLMPRCKYVVHPSTLDFEFSAQLAVSEMHESLLRALGVNASNHTSTSLRNKEYRTGERFIFAWNTERAPFYILRGIRNVPRCSLPILDLL